MIILLIRDPMRRLNFIRERLWFVTKELLNVLMRIHYFVLELFRQVSTWRYELMLKHLVGSKSLIRVELWHLLEEVLQGTTCFILLKDLPELVLFFPIQTLVVRIIGDCSPKGRKLQAHYKKSDCWWENVRFNCIVFSHLWLLFLIEDLLLLLSQLTLPLLNHPQFRRIVSLRPHIKITFDNRVKVIILTVFIDDKSLNFF